MFDKVQTCHDLVGQTHTRPSPQAPRLPFEGNLLSSLPSSSSSSFLFSKLDDGCSGCLELGEANPNCYHFHCYRHHHHHTTYLMMVALVVWNVESQSQLLSFPSSSSSSSSSSSPCYILDDGCPGCLEYEEANPDQPFGRHSRLQRSHGFQA